MISTLHSLRNTLENSSRLHPCVCGWNIPFLPGPWATPRQRHAIAERASAWRCAIEQEKLSRYFEILSRGAGSNPKSSIPNTPTARFQTSNSAFPTRNCAAWLRPHAAGIPVPLWTPQHSSTKPGSSWRTLPNFLRHRGYTSTASLPALCAGCGGGPDRQRHVRHRHGGGELTAAFDAAVQLSATTERELLGLDSQPF